MVSIKDIAKIAGINVSSVSRALSGSSEVGEETRKRVEAIAKELGYTPNYSARALVGKSTRLIGVIVPEINSNYYTQIVNCIENKLNEKGYNLLIGITGFKSEKEVQNLDTFIGRKVDGVVITSAIGDIDKVAADKKSRNLPVVFLEPIKQINRLDCIYIDGNYGVKLAVKHLFDLGHKSVGFIGEDLSTRYRLNAFKKSMEDFGIPFNEKYMRSGKERFELGGYLRTRELLTIGDMPTAIFAVYDNFAIGAMRALQEAGLSVPKDISVIGYDNIRESEYLSVPLTTVSPPIVEMASKGMELLFKRIEEGGDGAAENTVLYPELIVRKSTSLPGRHI